MARREQPDCRADSGRDLFFRTMHIAAGRTDSAGDRWIGRSGEQRRRSIWRRQIQRCRSPSGPERDTRHGREVPGQQRGAGRLHNGRGPVQRRFRNLCRRSELMTALLDLRDLRIRFGAAEAVRGISLQLDEGEVLGLVGESGSGKSARRSPFWACWDRRRRLPVRSCGRAPICRGFRKTLCASCAAGEIAMIFQEPMTALNPVMRIGRQVAEAAEAHFPSWTGREARRKAIAALEAVAIADAAADTTTIRTNSRAGSGSASSSRWRSSTGREC